MYICVYTYMCINIYIILYIICFFFYHAPRAGTLQLSETLGRLIIYYILYIIYYILYIIYYILYIYTDYDRDGNDHVCDVYIAWWMYIASVHSVSHTIHHSVFIIFYERSLLDPQPRPSCNFWTPILARAASRLKSRLAQNAPTSPLQLESNGKKCNGHTHA